ncbi:immunoglobulin-like domain-containing protein [Halobacillus sp. H74]|uniref:immunoglobulin-like domain-containing protein n=1 Tax=Halobacillus sp. H74 TaxID=3457436 RepID=UPI003FCE69B2
MKKSLGMLLLLVIIGCSDNSEPTDSPHEDDKAENSSGISYKIGEANDKVQPPDRDQWTAEDIYEQTEYEPYTGRFFKGLFAHNTFFMVEPGADVGSHESFPDEKVRVQLVERERNLEKVEVVKEKIYEDGEKLAVQIPSQTGALYTFSQEVLGKDDQVLDTDVVVYYVPPEEINARMYVDKLKFAQDDTMEVHIENWGPTILEFGTPYNLQQYTSNRWNDVLGDDKAFPSIGYTLQSEETHTQKIDLSRLELSSGKYRVIKSFDAQNTEVEAVLSVEFEIE